MRRKAVTANKARSRSVPGVDDGSPIRAAAVLNCVAVPQSADAFRPAFCDRIQRIYQAHNKL